MAGPSLPTAPEFLTWQEVDKLIGYLLPQLRGVVLRLRRPGGEPCRQEQGDAAHHGASSAASSDSASVTPGLARSRANTSPMLPEGAART